MCWRVTLWALKLHISTTLMQKKLKRLLIFLLFPSNKGISYAIEPCYDESKYGTYLEYLLSIV